jgi:hypothetical protein
VVPRDASAGERAIHTARQQVKPTVRLSKQEETMFFLGFIVGFLVCSIMVVDMLKRHNLFNDDGSIVDLGKEEAA